MLDRLWGISSWRGTDSGAVWMDRR